MADNDWDRKKEIDFPRGGGPKKVTLTTATHLSYDWSAHAGAVAAANAGLPAFRAWIAAGPFSADVKAHWAGLADPIVNDIRLAAIEPA